MARELDDEDAKLVTLARSAMARIQAKEGAAVRDLDGRSYAAARVVMPSFRVGALELAVAQAVSSGSTGLAAAAIVAAESDALISLAAVRDLGGEGVRVYVVDASGDVVRVLSS